MENNKKEEVAAVILGMCIAVIIWITILNREVNFEGRRFYPFFHTANNCWESIRRFGIRSNLLGNIILFVPLGGAIPMMTGWKWKTVAIGTGFSFFIEIIQLISRRGCFDPDDVVLNTIGCIIGYGLYIMVQKMLLNYPKNASDI